MIRNMVALACFMAMILIILTRAAIAGPLPACAARDVIIDGLRDKYGETRRSIGLTSAGSVVEIFASGASGTWTITITSPDGQTCMVSAGLAFEAVPEGEAL